MYIFENYGVYSEFLGTCMFSNPQSDPYWVFLRRTTISEENFATIQKMTTLCGRDEKVKEFTTRKRRALDVMPAKFRSRRRLSCSALC